MLKKLFLTTILCLFISPLALAGEIGTGSPGANGEIGTGSPTSMSTGEIGTGSPSANGEIGTGMPAANGEIGTGGTIESALLWWSLLLQSI